MASDRSFDLQEAYFDLLIQTKSNDVNVEGESILLQLIQI